MDGHDGTADRFDVNVTSSAHDYDMSLMRHSYWNESEMIPGAVKGNGMKSREEGKRGRRYRKHAVNLQCVVS